MSCTEVTAECDIEDETLRFKEFVDVAATSWPVCYRRSESRSIDTTGI